MPVASNYEFLLKKVRELALKAGRDPNEIKLIAVTKTWPLEHVMPAYEAGCRLFGENRVDEALAKMEQAPNDLQWHLIGTLQSKKVNKTIGKFALIHAVDSVKLAEKISAASLREGVVTSILLQANTSLEESKHGLTPHEWKISFSQVKKLEGLSIQGFMTMAPLTDDETVIRECFSQLRRLRDEIQTSEKCKLPELSMGMSNDYPIAIEEGATILRIGSSIFGA